MLQGLDQIAGRSVALQVRLKSLSQTTILQTTEFEKRTNLAQKFTYSYHQLLWGPCWEDSVIWAAYSDYP